MVVIVYRLVRICVGQVVLDVGIIVSLVQYVRATLRHEKVELFHLLFRFLYYLHQLQLQFQMMHLLYLIDKKERV